MTLGELAKVSMQPIICLDGMNGKVVFKRYESKLKDGHFEKYADVTVLSVWSEIVAEKPLGFTNYAHSVLKCYLPHTELEEVRKTYSEVKHG